MDRDNQRDKPVAMAHGSLPGARTLFATVERGGRSVDRDKRIEEIKADAEYKQKYSQEARDKLFLLEEIDRLNSINHTLSLAVGEADKAINRLQQEISSHGPEGRNYTNQQYVALRLERDKLIEGLRWYASDKQYIQELCYHDFEQNDPYYECPEILDDKGERARSILKELGL